MLLKSESFSLIYFRYRENEKMKQKTRIIFSNLKKFKIYSKSTQKWPNTETQDTSHIYKFVLYRADIECLDILMQVTDIYGWDYPDAPMDLCFYREGYCWLSITAHEYMAYLYTDNREEVEELRNIGADLTFCDEEVPVCLDKLINKIEKKE